MTTLDRLIRRRPASFGWGRLCNRILLHGYGLDLPPEVRVGNNVKWPHLGRGTVIHPKTIIEDNVTIFHGVTIGRVDAHLSESAAPYGGTVVCTDSVIFTGAVVLGGSEVLRIGRGSLVAANAVLRESTGDWEVWAGAPAKLVGRRRRTPESSELSSVPEPS